MPKPYSVDRSQQAYKDLIETVNEVRIALPQQALPRKGLYELEFVEPAKAPDHAAGSSTDLADAVAGVVGYLSLLGRGELSESETIPLPPRTITEMIGLLHR